MIFICTLVLVALLSLIFTSSIKRQYYIYYSISGVIAILTSIYEILRITSNMKLDGVLLTLEKTTKMRIFILFISVCSYFTDTIK